MFIVDSSSSIEQHDNQNWERVLEFMVTLVGEFNIGSDGVRVGVITYNQTAHLRWYLDEFDDSASLIAAIRDLEYRGGDTNIAAALRLARTELLRDNKGHRDDVPDLVILISDGNPNKDEDDTLDEADDLKDALEGDNAALITIGVTDEIDEELLAGIASDSTYVAMADDFTALDTIVNKVKNLACLHGTTASLGEY